MTLCVWAVNILTFTSNSFVICLSKRLLNFDIIQLNNSCRCSNVDCSRLLLVPYNTTCDFLTYSNNNNFSTCVIKMGYCLQAHPSPQKMRFSAIYFVC